LSRKFRQVKKNPLIVFDGQQGWYRWGRAMDCALSYNFYTANPPGMA